MQQNGWLVEDDRGDSFLYWGPKNREGKTPSIDPETMGITNIPHKPAGIAIILKEPGKLTGDDVTKMFPENGSIGEAGYGAPYDSLNVAYNHEWWTCLGDEEKRKNHAKICCKEGKSGHYQGNCTRYRKHLQSLCSLVFSTVEAANSDLTFLANIYFANLRYPSELGKVGFSKESSDYKNMSMDEKGARFMSLMDWMKNDSVKKHGDDNGEELKYAFVHYKLFAGLLEYLRIAEKESFSCLTYYQNNHEVQKVHQAFYLEDPNILILSIYHPQSRYKLDLNKSQKNIEYIRNKLGNR